MRQGFNVAVAYDVDDAQLSAMPPSVVRAASPRHVASAADVVVTGESVVVYFFDYSQHTIVIRLIQCEIFIEFYRKNYYTTQP